MRCTSPLTVGFQADGTTLCWSPTKYSKEFAPFQIPCGKCISCRMENARQKAIRCMHEAAQYEQNSFITLTYSDENLKSSKLIRRDIDLFIKKLRDHVHRELLERLFPNETQKTQRRLFGALPKDRRQEWLKTSKIKLFGVGEYGTRTLRPHWHLLTFNWRPSDAKLARHTDRGDRVFTSEILSDLWGYGITEFGDVTFESAGYCARYSLKKLEHGDDENYQPIPIYSKGLGKTFLEKFYLEIFTHGYLVINGEKSGIPRYYERWLKEHLPEVWKNYVTQTKEKIIQKAIAREEQTTIQEKLINLKRGSLKGLQIKRNQVREKIQQKKFKYSQQFMKF